MKKHLISFGSPDLKISIKRFLTQGKNLDYFDKIKVFSVKDLEIKDQKKLKNLLKKKNKL